MFWRTMMQNIGARLKYTEQHRMSNIYITMQVATWVQALHTSLASQRVKGYHKNAHGMAAKQSWKEATVAVESLPAS